jgi:hypothetical protein
MCKLRLNFRALTYDISEVEDYFREIGLLDQFLQLKFNYLVIKDYCISYEFKRSIFDKDEEFFLKDIEEKLLKM